MLTGIDHVTIAVRELEPAIAGYTRLLGSPPSWRGEHPEHGTRGALFGLSNTLIELTSPADSPAGEGLRALLEERGEGLIALAFASDALAGDCSAWRARGLRMSAPEAGTAYGAHGEVRQYSSAEFSPRTTRGLRVYAVERADMHTLRASTAPPDDAVYALDHAVVQSADLDAAVTLYGDQLGIRLALDRRGNGPRMLFFRTSGVTLEIVPDPAGGAHDRFYGLAYRVRDLDAAHARLRAAGFTLNDPRPGNKPGTRVFSVRDGTSGVPTLVLCDPTREQARG